MLHLQQVGEERIGFRILARRELWWTASLVDSAGSVSVALPDP